MNALLAAAAEEPAGWLGPGGWQEAALFVVAFVAAMIVAFGTIWMLNFGHKLGWRKLSAFVVALLLVGGGGLYALEALNDRVSGRSEAERQQKLAKERDKAKAEAKQERQAKRTKEDVAAAVVDQYAIEEVRNGSWTIGDARGALSRSKMDSPSIEVLTEDSRRVTVQVEYDKRTKEVTLISDVQGIDVDELRRGSGS